MIKEKFNNLKKDNNVKIKYMLGDAHVTEDVSIYKFDEELQEEVILSSKESVKVLFTTGPWIGKEFSFIRNEIK